MRDAADILLEDLDAENRASLTLFDPDWHQGVIGILAGRVKEQLHRPTFAFARGNDGLVKGSGRSIAGLHLRDALDLIAKQHPNLLKRFGGHAAAAGVTLDEDDLGEFEAAFEEVARSLIPPAELSRTLQTDGALETGYLSLNTARLIRNEIWGQALPAPVFADVFEVENQKVLKDKHLKLSLRQGKARFEGIRFNCTEPATNRILAAYRLDVNDWNGLSSLQLLIEHFEPAV
jgi:single-stranded-DNA-specific exonuclease